MIQESARAVELQGFPLAIISTILVFVVLASISVAIRTIVRIGDNIFGLDDWLLVAGLVSTHFYSY